jgi:1A family penicillin-binding protein
LLGAVLTVAPVLPLRLPDRLTELAGAARRRRGLLVAVALVVVLGPPLAFGVWTWRTAAGVDLSRPEEAALIYAAGQVLTPGVSIEAADLTGTLRRLGYRETPSAPATPGQFHRDAAFLEIHLRPRDDPSATRSALPIRLLLDGDRIRQVVTVAGEPLSEIELEPETLTGLGGAANQLRHPMPLAAMPKHLVQAVLAIEDQRFYEHHGVDVRAVARAVWVNLRRGQVAQGASTLTQQLVKNLVLTPKRTWGRKAREAAIAVAIERRYSKDEILSAYLNGIYLGQHGGFAVYGVGAAARSFFGKDVERITLGEAATIAGVIRAPNTYSPVQHLDRARERRNAVLHRMRDLGMLDDKRLAQATHERLVVQRGNAINALGPYFADWVRGQVEQIQPADESSTSGLRIYTTLNPVLQRAAEAALARGLDRLEGQYRGLRRSDPTARLQGAIVALDPRTGEIRAMVGGRDYGQSQFNRIVQAHRQPGSAFKPFVYLAALGQGPRGEPPHFTPASLLEDRPLTIGTGRDTWTPRNYDNRYEGTVTVRRALEQSLNAGTVWMAETVGYDAIIRAARDAGFTSPMEPVPALALGSFEVTPIELASAFGTLANGGDRFRPSGLRAVADREGGVSEPERDRSPGLRPEEAFLITNLLRGVIDRGTGAAARALGVEGPVAGKTGTTNEGRDTWFVGYTPRLVALVWVGFDQRDVLRLSGAQAALPIWADFMRTAMAVVPAGAPEPPLSITFREIDAANGKLATAWCPVVIREAFLASTEPRENCPDHGPAAAARSFFRRLFQPSDRPTSDRPTSDR